MMFAEDLPSSPNRCSVCHKKLELRGKEAYYCPRCDEQRDRNGDRWGDQDDESGLPFLSTDEG
jgi:predicted amidophosphoribosyltransferase